MKLKELNTVAATAERRIAGKNRMTDTLIQHNPQSPQFTQSASNTPAAPMPLPIHMVTMPYFF